MNKRGRGGGSQNVEIFHGRHMCIIPKKERKTVAVTCFEKEKMHFTEGALKNKQWVIKKLNQSTITDLNVFKESSESLTRNSLQMNTLPQHMAKSLQEATEKSNVLFHFRKTFHYNSVYYEKIGLIESVTIEEFIPGKFVK